MRNKDTFSPKGHLKIYKQYLNGTEELIFDEHNIIVSGMGVGLSYLFSASGSDKITDFQIRFAQLGSDGDLNNYGTSTFELNSPLDSDDYSVHLLKSTHTQIKNGATVTSQSFIEIPFNHIQKISPTAVRFTIVIPSEALNTLEDNLSEIGLFMSNPKKTTPKQSILVAYRPFTEIIKTEEFALLFKWIITF